MYRRTIIKLLAAATGWARAIGVRAFADTVPLTDAHMVTLRAAARAVLPSTLGSKGADAATDKFVRWLRAYKAGADMDHGYGVTRLRSTPPSPAAAYPKHLAELEAMAAKGQPFAKLSADAQRELIASALTAAQIDALPNRPNGRHVVADLMAFYFRSSEANDDCYKAMINREVCRPILVTTRKPEPIGKG